MAEASPRALTAGAVLFLAAIVLVRSTPLTLSGIDAACYANIAKALASRPLSTWLDVRWMDGPFFEHPPLALWVEGLWFSSFGASAVSAVWLARLYAALLALVVWWGARSFTGPLEAAFSVVGLTTLASFQRETQNPMLEAPLGLACAAALVACMHLRSARGAIVAFAAAATAAVWIKGIVALALVFGLGWALLAGAPWRRVLAALGCFAALVIVTFAAFEALRAAQGLGPYLAPYFEKHVLVAFSEGRHNREPSPFFHLPSLVRWHLSALLAVPMLAWGWRTRTADQKRLALLGLGWIVAVVFPFSLAQQKSEWHINVLIPGAAWLLGVSLASLPARLIRLAPGGLVVASVIWGLFQLRGTAPENHRQHAIIALTNTPASLGGAPVANCSVLTPWVSRHLFAFHWDAVPAECEAPAAWRFDGASLMPISEMK